MRKSVDAGCAHMIIASQSKKLSSAIGPATIPSGGFTVNSTNRILLEINLSQGK